MQAKQKKHAVAVFILALVTMLMTLAGCNPTPPEEVAPTPSGAQGQVAQPQAVGGMTDQKPPMKPGMK
jgi:hypothetical protein